MLAKKRASELLREAIAARPEERVSVEKALGRCARRDGRRRQVNVAPDRLDLVEDADRCEERDLGRPIGREEARAGRRRPHDLFGGD